MLMISGCSRHQSRSTRKALVVPIGIDDQIDRELDAERAGEFERLEIAPERHPLAVFEQALFVDRFEAEEHVGDAEPFQKRNTSLLRSSTSPRVSR